MLKVWKFPFEITDEVSLDIPRGAQILTVQLQHGMPYLWALVDAGEVKERRTFAVEGTGHPVADGGRYVGTFQVYGGDLVFHVFETTPRDER